MTDIQGAQGIQGVAGTAGAVGAAGAAGGTDPVIAYRVGQLEVAVRDGFKEHNQKLDSIITNFATKADLATVATEVAELYRDVDSLKSVDARQQGSIDTSRRLLSLGLTFLGILVSAIAVYLGLHHK